MSPSGVNIQRKVTNLKDVTILSPKFMRHQHNCGHYQPWLYIFIFNFFQVLWISLFRKKVAIVKKERRFFDLRGGKWRWFKGMIINMSVCTPRQWWYALSMPSRMSVSSLKTYWGKTVQEKRFGKVSNKY